ncbi:MAG: nucleotidyltransferase [bacterium]|nr:nucleotidyltransferase [bacterium]
MDSREVLAGKREKIVAIAARYGARNVRVFGSVARGDADDKSDVDFVVDFDDGASLMDHAGLLMELQELLGRKVDVAPEKYLRPRLRDRVLEEAVPL